MSRAHPRPLFLVIFLLSATLSAAAKEAAVPKGAIEDAYLERYLRTFPTAATAAGDHRFAAALEELSPEEIESWLAFNREVVAELEQRLRGGSLLAAERIDAEVLLRQARLQVFELSTLRRHENDPLYWTSILSRAAVFLLVREDRPLEIRLEALAERVEALPRLIADALASLSRGDPARTAPVHCRRAASQARALADFYRGGLREPAAELPPGARSAEIGKRLLRSGEQAAGALDQLATFIDTLAVKARGSFRLGEHYAQVFRLTTGVTDDLDEVLRAAEAALAAKRAEAAAHCRELWPRELATVPQPDDEHDLIRRCFDRIDGDGPTDVAEHVDVFRRLVAQAEAFVREKELMTLPPRLEVRVERYPAYLGAAAFGGLYPPGPFSPEGASLLFVPTPPESATPEELASFFRGFNRHFNVMITPHETVPGHAAQMTLAARGPSPLRALFADGVYVEGWGTFSERLMLDAGWGDDLTRAAHLKKQLENVARTIVDIRIHTRGMSRDEALAFVRGEALQDEQLAANLWSRSLTSAPQITTYWLGYRQVWDLYRDLREARGDRFVLRELTDGLMQLGPVPIRHYRELFFPSPSDPDTARKAGSSVAAHCAPAADPLECRLQKPPQAHASGSPGLPEADVAQW